MWLYCLSLLCRREPLGVEYLVAKGADKSIPVFTQEKTFDVRVPLSGVTRTYWTGGQRDRF